MKRKTLATLSITVLRSDTKVKRTYKVFNFYLIKYSVDGTNFLFKAYAEVNGKKSDEKKDLSTITAARKHFNKIRDKFLSTIK